MKNLKLLFYSLLISLATLTSCTNNDDVNLPEPQESAALQASLDNLRTLYNEDGTVNNDLNPTGNLIFDFCFEFIYPINLFYNTGTTVEVNSNEELITILINTTNDLYIVGIEFPFSVQIYNPNTNEVEIITINNESEFAALIVNCNFNDDCDISELEIEVGECTSQNTYTLTLDFEYENTDQEFFNLYVRDSLLIGYYPLLELPLTIEDFELSGYENDYLKVRINDGLYCSEEIEWEAPDCNGNILCYEYVFPVSLTLNGITVTVNSNQELDDYLSQGYNLSYPIDIIIDGEVITVQQGILEGDYGPRCE